MKKISITRAQQIVDDLQISKSGLEIEMNSNIIETYGWQEIKEFIIDIFPVQYLTDNEYLIYLQTLEPYRFWCKYKSTRNDLGANFKSRAESRNFAFITLSELIRRSLTVNTKYSFNEELL